MDLVEPHARCEEEILQKYVAPEISVFVSLVVIWTQIEVENFWPRYFCEYFLLESSLKYYWMFVMEECYIFYFFLILLQPYGFCFLISYYKLD